MKKLVEILTESQHAISYDDVVYRHKRPTTIDDVANILNTFDLHAEMSDDSSKWDQSRTVVNMLKSKFKHFLTSKQLDDKLDSVGRMAYDKYFIHL